MVVCGVLTLVLVPALLPARVAVADPLDGGLAAALVVQRHRRAILVAAALITIAALDRRAAPAHRSVARSAEADVAGEQFSDRSGNALRRAARRLSWSSTRGRRSSRCSRPTNGWPRRSCARRRACRSRRRRRCCRRRGRRRRGRGADRGPSTSIPARVATDLHAAAEAAGFKAGTFDAFVDDAAGAARLRRCG